MRVLLMMIGGTIAQKAVGGRMQIVLSAEDLAASLETDVELILREFPKRSGAELTLETLFDVRDTIRAHPCMDGYVLITGTDSMEEVAFGLDLLLAPDLTLVITGAIKPADVAGYDGLANLQDALRVALDRRLRGLGAVVVINNDVHPARYVRKVDSALIGAFRSHPGPIAQIRRGQPIVYYEGLPPMARFDHVRKGDIRGRVMVWPMTIDPCLPEAMLEGLDGLVIAGMGTGSVASQIVDLLSPRWASRMPIVLSSRCPVGLSFDDHNYRGSLEKYESRGFRVLGYEHCNPLQARLKLLFEIAGSKGEA